MAEAVKNNGRSRRPPSHLRAEYNQDNFEPGVSQYSRNREAQRQASDPCSILLMARLLSKFLASVNKKYLQSKALKAQQEANVQTKKQPNETSRSSYKVQKSTREDRITTTPKAQISGQTGTAAVKSKQTPQGYTNVTDSKPTKTQPKPTDTLIKGNFPPDNLFSVQSMAKMSRQQLLKMVPKGIDPSLLKQHTKQLQQDQSTKKQSKQSLSKHQQSRPSMCRPDSKLFKRAAFHIGIAYNIHIDKVKHENPNYSTDDLDPTLISRRMKSQSMEQARRRIQEAERLRLHQQALIRQRAQQNQQNRSPQDSQKKQGSEKKPVFIQIEEDQSQMKPQKQQEKSLKIENVGAKESGVGQMVQEEPKQSEKNQLEIKREDQNQNMKQSEKENEAIENQDAKKEEQEKDKAENAMKDSENKEDDKKMGQEKIEEPENQN